MSGHAGNSTTVTAIRFVHAGTSNPSALCPDMLRYEQIGEADDLRGRVVRGFFWLMQAWPPKAWRMRPLPPQ